MEFIAKKDILPSDHDLLYTFRITINCKSERHKTLHELKEVPYSVWKSSNELNTQNFPKETKCGNRA